VLWVAFVARACMKYIAVGLWRPKIVCDSKTEGRRLSIVNKNLLTMISLSFDHVLLMARPGAGPRSLPIHRPTLRIQRSQTEPSSMPARSLGQTRHTRTLSALRPATNNRHLIRPRAPGVEQEVIGQEESPGTDCDGAEDELYVRGVLVHKVGSGRRA